MRMQTPKHARPHTSVPYSTSRCCSHCSQCSWASVFNFCAWFTPVVLDCCLSLYLYIAGLRQGPGKMFLGVLEFFVTRRMWVLVWPCPAGWCVKVLPPKYEDVLQMGDDRELSSVAVLVSPPPYCDVTPEDTAACNWVRAWHAAGLDYCNSLQRGVTVYVTNSHEWQSLVVVGRIRGARFTKYLTIMPKLWSTYGGRLTYQNIFQRTQAFLWYDYLQNRRAHAIYVNVCDNRGFLNVKVSIVSYHYRRTINRETSTSDSFSRFLALYKSVCICMKTPAVLCCLAWLLQLTAETAVHFHCIVILHQLQSLFARVLQTANVSGAHANRCCFVTELKCQRKSGSWKGRGMSGKIIKFCSGSGKIMDTDCQLEGHGYYFTLVVMWQLSDKNSSGKMWLNLCQSPTFCLTYFITH